MRKFLALLAVCLLSIGLRAQSYDELGAKLEEYFAALVGRALRCRMRNATFS